MKLKIKNKNILSLNELEPKEIEHLLDLALELKKQNKKGDEKPLLKKKSLAIIFDVDVIMARVYDHDILEEFSEHSNIPVINGLSDLYHPCQTLADFMTIKEHKKNLKKIKIAWIGDGNNVCNSLIFGCSKLKTKISVATPDGFEPSNIAISTAKLHTDIEITNDPIKAVKDADVVMTDTFISIHNTDEDRLQKFLPKFQVNADLMGKAKKDAIFLHCLPAKRDQEVTSDVIDGPQSVVWDEAENRLHIQKALLVSLLNV